VLDDVLSCAWACEVEASGVVVDAERSLIAPGNSHRGVRLGRRRDRADPVPSALSLRFCDRVSRQVMRGASCPVLVVVQGQA
jgi:hypothetical protein